MNKNKNLLILIIFGVLLSAGFVLTQIPASSGGMLATPLVKSMQEQLNILRKQAQELTIELRFLENEQTSAPEEDSFDKRPPVLANLEPECVTSSSAIITWQTNELSDSAVIYSTDYLQRYINSKNKLTAENPAWATHHAVRLTGLKSGTMYYYYVSSSDINGNNALSNTHTITTLVE